MRYKNIYFSTGSKIMRDFKGSNNDYTIYQELAKLSNPEDVFDGDELIISKGSLITTIYELMEITLKNERQIRESLRFLEIRNHILIDRMFGTGEKQLMEIQFLKYDFFSYIS